MNLTLNPKRGVAGYVIGLWLVIMIFVLFIVIILGVVICMIKTITKIVPPPDPDPEGNAPGLGDYFAGGTIIGYAPPPRHFAPTAAPPGFTVSQVMIYASDTPYAGADLAKWTNCIWTGPLDQLTNQLGSNGVPVESWPVGDQPFHRFYNILFQTNAP